MSRATKRKRLSRNDGLPERGIVTVTGSMACSCSSRRNDGLPERGIVTLKKLPAHRVWRYSRNDGLPERGIVTSFIQLMALSTASCRNDGLPERGIVTPQPARGADARSRVGMTDCPCVGL